MGIIRKARRTGKLVKYAVIATLMIAAFRTLPHTVQDKAADMAVKKIVELSIVQNCGIEISEDELKAKADQLIDKINSEDMEHITAMAKSFNVDGTSRQIEKYLKNLLNGTPDNIKGILDGDELGQLKELYEKYTE